MSPMKVTLGCLNFYTRPVSFTCCLCRPLFLCNGGHGQSIPYIVHCFPPEHIGIWWIVVHYLWNRVPFGTSLRQREWWYTYMAKMNAQLGHTRWDRCLSYPGLTQVSVDSTKVLWAVLCYLWPGLIYIRCLAAVSGRDSNPGALESSAMV